MPQRFEGLTVGDVMTRDLVTVTPDTDVRELKRLFEVHEFNTIPVVDPGGALQGLVTKLDLLRVFRPDRRRLMPDLGALNPKVVADIMSRGFVDVTPDEPVVAAVDIMLDLNLRSLPVTEGRKEGRLLVGMVSRKDVLRTFVFDEPKE